LGVKFANIVPSCHPAISGCQGLRSETISGWCFSSFSTAGYSQVISDFNHCWKGLTSKNRHCKQHLPFSQLGSFLIHAKYRLAHPDSSLPLRARKWNSTRLDQLMSS
jgi:hypothetical protein